MINFIENFMGFSKIRKKLDLWDIKWAKKNIYFQTIRNFLTFVFQIYILASTFDQNNKTAQFAKISNIYRNFIRILFLKPDPKKITTNAKVQKFLLSCLPNQYCKSHPTDTIMKC